MDEIKTELVSQVTDRGFKVADVAKRLIAGVLRRKDNRNSRPITN